MLCICYYTKECGINTFNFILLLLGWYYWDFWRPILAINLCTDVKKTYEAYRLMTDMKIHIQLNFSNIFVINISLFSLGITVKTLNFVSSDVLVLLSCGRILHP